MSVGHDEYWSSEQRANVEAARDAGVQPGLLHRQRDVLEDPVGEAASTAPATDYRTLVCYKETKANAKIDAVDDGPAPGATRASARPDGGRPENAWPATSSWSTAAATTASRCPPRTARCGCGGNTIVADHGRRQHLPSGPARWATSGTTVPDNGFRPPGVAEDVVDDRGRRRVPPAELRRHSTAPARRPTRSPLPSTRAAALVFGAGTVQWAWGAGRRARNRPRADSDVRMQQATVNFLADMGAQPDHAAVRPEGGDGERPTPRAARRRSPPAPAASTVGSRVTFSGTAADAGGRGRRRRGLDRRRRHVAPGGQAGAAAWSYTWTPASAARRRSCARAVDDSANLETPAAGVTVGADPPVPVQHLDRRRDTGRPSTPTTRTRWSWGSSSRPTAAAMSPACGSTRARGTPARTPAACGPRRAAPGHRHVQQ